jgi:hypothetical protein
LIGSDAKLTVPREWPNPLDWEQGPDPLRYPGLYDIIKPDHEDEDDLEPLDLEKHDPAPQQTLTQKPGPIGALCWRIDATP